MFELIAYIFKIIISLGIGYIVGYNHKKVKESIEIQFNTTLLSFFSAALTGIIVLFSDFNINFIGIIFFAMIYIVINQYDEYNIINKNKLLFAGINGIIVGMGYVFYSIIITLLFTYIVNNYDIISQLFNKQHWDLTENEDDEKNQIDINE